MFFCCSREHMTGFNLGIICSPLDTEHMTDFDLLYSADNVQQRTNDIFQLFKNVSGQDNKKCIYVFHLMDNIQTCKDWISTYGVF